jgi:cation diffusion facilitator CzcD-associated flavoprotein CzcO
MADRNFDAVIVGAGFGGLCMLHRLRTMGLRARVFEAGSGVGGTWFWNRYPGARCDIESMQYSFQFSEDLQQEWEWSERYAAQPEILSYANHVADQFDLRRDIQLDTRVQSAVFDESAGQWSVATSDGTRSMATFCIMATGCLSSPTMPKIDGIDRFEGQRFHTGHWPHEPVDFTGQRVAVIGTGSSAIQSIPIIAGQAKHLYVFQRTANYSIPAHNKPLDVETRRTIKANYSALRAEARKTMSGIVFDWSDKAALDTPAEELQREYEARWENGGLAFLGAYKDLLVSEEANTTAAEFVRGKIRGIVHDPVVADALVPTNVLGCKRLCVDTNYYATFKSA